MKRICIDCGKEFDAHDKQQVRCPDCQRIHKLQVMRNYWHRNSDKYINRNLTTLGGKEVTMEDIKNYKGRVAKDSEFIKNNEAEDTNNAYFTVYYDEDDFEIIKNKTLKEIYWTWRHGYYE